MNAKVLIVDDSSLARRMLRQTLEEMGHTVEEAADGPSALERYYLNRHDLVLLDMVMNGMYGLEVLTKLRQLDASAKVIVVSADVQSSSHELVTAAGAAGFLTKPLEADAILALVRSTLEKEPRAAQ